MINMNKNLYNENQTIEEIKNTFHTAEIKLQRKSRIIVKLRSDLIPPFLSYAKNYLAFNHLAHFSCVDWIEDNEFELVYLLYSYEKNIVVIAKTRISRDKAEFVTIKHLWRQAETYEREIHEMFGINFTGNDRLNEFILEDWDDIPPMRRDFNTIQFAKDNFYTRPGREDAQDVRETITKKSGEKIPDFAKEFSVRNLK